MYYYTCYLPNHTVYFFPKKLLTSYEKVKSANIYSFYSKKFQVTPAAVTAASASASPAQTQSQQITTGKIAQTAAQQQPVVAGQPAGQTGATVGQNSTSTNSPSGSLALKLYPAVMIIMVAAILNI